MSNSTALKDIKFTTCHRKTVFVYTETIFTESDFVTQLSESNRAKWDAYTDDIRKKIWANLKKKFPFETGNNTWDPHNNWIEEWDTEEMIEEKEKWDYHPWVKQTIATAVDTLADNMCPGSS